jgi:hypothetical protein
MEHAKGIAVAAIVGKPATPFERSRFGRRIV